MVLQAMSMFSSALASGQLGPLLSQFGLPAEAVDAANRGGDAHARTHTHRSHDKDHFLPSRFGNSAFFLLEL